jgi:FAD/FMN-containing dehydrogenase
MRGTDKRTDGGVNTGQENSIPQDPARTRTLEHRLQRETQGSVLFDPASRGRYATDASIYQIMPLGVFIPRVESDVSTAIDIARELKLPVLARGAGSSQCGQTVGEALVIDGSRHLRQIIDIDVAARTAVVQPGVVLDELNARLRPHGLWFPVDVSTGAQATLGGMAGNNSCGSRSIAYGNMVHNVLGLNAWLSDGSSVEFGTVAELSGRAAQIATFVQQLALEHRDQIIERWTKLLRSVGG